MFLPYDDINPTERTPFVTWILIALNVVAFAATYDILTMESPQQQAAALREVGALIPAQPEPLDFLASMFLHGSVVHLLGNMLFLWIMGDNIEDEFGHVFYTIFYVATGVLAALSHVAIDPSSTVPLVGASGAISGVMGAYLVLFPHSRIKFFYWFYFFIGTAHVRAFWWLAFWIGLQLLSGAAAGAAGGGVAYAAHIGGFVAGVVITGLAKFLGFVEGGVDDQFLRERPPTF